MSVSFQQLRSILKESGLPVFRDEPASSVTYPYVVYEFVNETHKRASSRVLKSLPMYQISVITNGVETDYEPLKNALNSYGVSFSQFEGLPYDENDDTITQFITYVRCVN
ncbi:hypothetical protein K7887_18370 [Sutcliffiella horikoshii]|uniref:hypothetical protein n=1 Tax=Sutcliffiella horikoshii TaxID=79883 RepID=UPI001CBD385A|nr:hypothetical protein [Sutcliffiella horikoshii]UAL46810.1 hypothetical protein K7887_18370 [Sutcliffiella horikoshii]